MTLVEVVVASAIFVVLAAGILSTTVMVRRSMNRAIARGIAFDTAQGFLEQIKVMPFSRIHQAWKVNASIPIPCDPQANTGVASDNSGGDSDPARYLALRPGNPTVPPDGAGAMTDGRWCGTYMPRGALTDAGNDGLAAKRAFADFRVQLVLENLYDDLRDPAVNDVTDLNRSYRSIRVTINYAFKMQSANEPYQTGKVSYVTSNFTF